MGKNVRYNSVAIVTGAGSGIGKATAVLLAQRGVAVACFDLRNTAETARQINEAQGRALSYDGDVGNIQDWDKLHTLVKAQFGPVNLLANVAGAFEPYFDSIATVPLDLVDKIINANLKGPLLGMRTVLPDMIDRGNGKIVNVSSLASRIFMPGIGTYCASKAGIEALTCQVATEYGIHNIQINAIQPGSVDTPLLRKNKPENVAAVAKAKGIKGLAKPEEPAAVIVFLLSSAADYINGAIIKCGG